MPSPSNLLDLVEFPDSTNKSFEAAMGSPLYWEHLEQGRLFLLTNYANTALTLGKCKKARDLSQHAGVAVRFIKGNRPEWLREFKTPGWQSFNTGQIRSALYQEPMQLVKAAISIVTLEYCIQSESSDEQKAQHDAQLYKAVRIVPAFWRLDGFNRATYDRLGQQQKDQCVQAILACGIPRAHHVLSELAAGHHVTHTVASALHNVLALPIATARRANSDSGRGNVKSACPSFSLP